MNKKTIIGTLAGAVTFFLLGYIFYGLVFSSFISNNTNSGIWRSMETMVWWAMIVSNLVWAYFMAMIFEWTNTNGLAAGIQKGLILGVLTSLGFNLGLYATTVYYNSLNASIIDAGIVTLMSGIAGAVIGLTRGSGAQTKETQTS